MGRKFKRADLDAALEEAKRNYPLDTGFNLEMWKRDPEAIELLMDRVAAGYSVRQYCKEMKMPERAYTSINRWLSKLEPGDNWYAAYDIARNARANQFAERMLDIVGQVENGLMTAQQGSMCVKSLQWLAERLDPERWSNRVKIDAKVTQDSTEAHLAAVRMLAGMVQSGERGTVIDYVDPDGQVKARRVEEPPVDVDDLDLLE